MNQPFVDTVVILLVLEFAAYPVSGIHLWKEFVRGVLWSSGAPGERGGDAIVANMPPVGITLARMGKKERKKRRGS